MVLVPLRVLCDVGIVVSSSLLIVLLLLLLVIPSSYGYYYYKPCTRTVQYDFQYPNCYVPDMNRSILFTEASFVLSHDAATGYLVVPSSFTNNYQNNSNIRKQTTTIPIASNYYKNQIGTVYDQLQAGARALDLRPYLLRNGTVQFQHDIIRIAISQEQIVHDVLRWTTENPTELVLLLTSHFAYEKLSSVSRSKRNYTTSSLSSYYTNKDIVSALLEIYTTYGINYVPCSAVYGLSVGEVMDNLAQVKQGIGYILAMDGHDNDDGTFCGKQNWLASTAQQLSCYPTNKVSCQTSNVPFEKNVKPYIKQCITNPQTSNYSHFGPSTDTYHYPLNMIQVLWQVTALSAIRGMTHFSSILQDTEKSNIHENIIDMIYNNNELESYPISLIAVDNVAYHGNAIYSVLRTRCGQSVSTICGTQLEKPKLHGRINISKNDVIVAVCLLYLMIVLVTIRKTKRPKLLFTLIARLDVKWNQYYNRFQDDTIDPISSHNSDPISRKQSFLK